VYTQATRPMQGQSPWTVNFSVTFTEPEWGTSVSLLYNKFGRRLAAVGDERNQDVYDEPRDLLDASVSQRLFGLLEAKFAVKNVLDRDLRLTSGKGRIFYGARTEGRSYALSMSFTL
jgi:outer membrane receptor protein involved in Fe transport